MVRGEPRKDWIEAQEQDGVLTIRIPTLDPMPLSKTGKSKIVATTRGIVPVACGNRVLRIGLNVFIPR